MRCATLCKLDCMEIHLFIYFFIYEHSLILKHFFSEKKIVVCIFQTYFLQPHWRNLKQAIRVSSWITYSESGIGRFKLVRKRKRPIPVIFFVKNPQKLRLTASSFSLSKIPNGDGCEGHSTPWDYNFTLKKYSWLV